MKKSGRLLVDVLPPKLNSICLTPSEATNLFACIPSIFTEGNPIDSLSAIPQLVPKKSPEQKPSVSDSSAEQFGNNVPFPTVSLRGMKIHSVSLNQTVDYLMDCSSEHIGGWVVTPNLDILRRYSRSVSFRNLVATATLNVADGMPLVWASKIKGEPLPGRVNGTDLMISVCEAASLNGKSVFFLGGNVGSAETAAEAMQKDYPGLKVAGCHCPEFGFENSIKDVAEIAKILKAADPDFVFVGLGSPKQDVLINMLRLQLPKVWWLGVGVSFSFIACEIARAPEWAKKTGFEWFYRMCAEPRRLFKRYIVTGVPFLITTFIVSAFERFFGNKSE